MIIIVMGLPGSGKSYFAMLNEVAFLCMVLDAFDRRDLSDLFISIYNDSFRCMRSEEERRLFIYYKSYRANVRAKVNSLRARRHLHALIIPFYLTIERYYAVSEYKNIRLNVCLT